MAQSDGAVEYTHCICVERLDSSNECPRYDTKQSDDEAPVMLVFENSEYPFTVIPPRSTLVRSGSTW